MLNLSPLARLINTYLANVYVFICNYDIIMNKYAFITDNAFLISNAIFICFKGVTHDDLRLKGAMIWENPLDMPFVRVCITKRSSLVVIRKSTNII